MAADLPEFDKAEYVAPPAYQSHLREQSIGGEIISGDVDIRDWNARQADHARFVQAILYGIAAAVFGSIVYAAFTIITRIEIGYLAVGVGYLIGKAMLQATHGLGGRKYQITSAVLTYLAVSMAAVPEILWGMRSRGVDIAHISSRGIIALAKYGIASPFLDLGNGGIGGFIGLFILFIGIRAAWQFTADKRVPT